MRAYYRADGPDRVGGQCQKDRVRAAEAAPAGRRLDPFRKFVFGQIFSVAALAVDGSLLGLAAHEQGDFSAALREGTTDGSAERAASYNNCVHVNKRDLWGTIAVISDAILKQTRCPFLRWMLRFFEASKCLSEKLYVFHSCFLASLSLTTPQLLMAALQMTQACQMEGWNSLNRRADLFVGCYIARQETGINTAIMWCSTILHLF